MMTQDLEHLETLELWKRDWKRGHSPWHGEEADLLFQEAFEMHYQAHLKQSEVNRAFIPLCGNSFSVAWLMQRGSQVTGIDISQEALDDLIKRDFSELRFREESSGQHKVYRADKLTLVCGDFFAWKPEVKFQLIYDRGALIAIEPKLRNQYAKKLTSMLHENGVLAVEKIHYDTASPIGAPYSVSDEALRELFPECEMKQVALKFQETNKNRKLSEAGVEEVSKTLWKIYPPHLKMPALK